MIQLDLFESYEEPKPFDINHARVTREKAEEALKVSHNVRKGIWAGQNKLLKIVTELEKRIVELENNNRQKV